MTAPNANVLWAERLVDELVAGGLEAVCIAPGSRSTPLTVAFAEHDEVRVFSHLDERSAGYFALGRGRRTGEPTAVVSTSGTATANFHPAVMEADQGRVPLVVLTADRPPELRDSGANQTADQEKLYGDAVRWYRDLPEPEPTARKLRRLRVDAGRALAEATGAPAGPVHLNVPFRKPLEPIEVPDDAPDGVPDGWADGDERAAAGRDGPYVRTGGGAVVAADEAARIGRALAEADRPLIVAGPADPGRGAPEAVVELSRAIGAPLLSDPLSGTRFCDHVDDAPVVAGYDAYLHERVTGDWPDPDVVVRFGASPTSKPLRKYLARTDARGVLVDPAGGWRDAEFVTGELIAADPGPFARAAADAVRESGADGGARPGAAAATPGDWRDRWRRADRTHWSTVEDADRPHEGAIVATAFEAAPDPATVFVSNSMPVRDADRFARPRTADLTVLGNRGVSGIDGIVSAALGAGSAADEPLVAVVGDLALYHDANGLLAVRRCGVEATIVCINNDGGGIFHELPIERFDPPFTEQFRTPHGMDFADLASQYGLAYERVDPDGFADAYRAALGADGSHLVEVTIDAEASHRERERLADAVRADLA